MYVKDNTAVVRVSNECVSDEVCSKLKNKIVYYIGLI